MMYLNNVGYTLLILLTWRRDIDNSATSFILIHYTKFKVLYCMSLLIIESKIVCKIKSLSDPSLENSQILIIIAIRVTSFGIYVHFKVLTWILVHGCLSVVFHYRLVCGASYLRHHFYDIKLDFAKHISPIVWHTQQGTSSMLLMNYFRLIMIVHLVFMLALLCIMMPWRPLSGLVLKLIRIVRIFIWRKRVTIFVISSFDLHFLHPCGPLLKFF